MNHAMARIIKSKLARFPLDDCQPIHARSLDLGDPLPPRRGNRVVALSGIRRCGKSHRLFQEMGRLVAEGVPRHRICYFDFEDDRLGDVTPELGAEVLAMFFDLFPAARLEGAFLFLDGIHAMAGWRPWVRRVSDELRATTYVATSTSGISDCGGPPSGEEGIVERRLYPYSFAEYLRAAAVNFETHVRGKKRRAAKRRAIRFDALAKYLRDGGFPETVELSDDSRVRLLQEYVARIVCEDVIEASNCPNPQVAARFARRVLGTNSQALSLRKAVGSLERAGLSVEKDFLRGLLEAILRSGLMFRIPCFDLAEGEAPRDRCKLYAVDPGLARACARTHGNAISFLLENAVYLELRRRTARNGLQLRCIRSCANNHEVDFVVGDPLSDEFSKLYQVTWSLGKKSVRKREVRSILETFDEVARLKGDGGAVLPSASILICNCTPQSLAEGQRYLSTLGERASRITLVPAPEWLLNVPTE